MKRFTCAHCGGSFRQGWSDAEAQDEARETFGYQVPEAEQRVLCDDCIAAFKRWLKTLTPAERAELDAEVLRGRPPETRFR